MHTPIHQYVHSSSCLYIHVLVYPWIVCQFVHMHPSINNLLSHPRVICISRCIHQSIHPFICSFIYPHVQLSSGWVSVCAHPSICMSSCLFVCSSIHPCAFPSIHPSVPPSARPPLRLSIRLPVIPSQTGMTTVHMKDWINSAGANKTNKQPSSGLFQATVVSHTDAAMPHHKEMCHKEGLRWACRSRTGS